ncbi:hypothetical protein B0T25DRAFT_567903 [Lasiosphaeria hispida]|uniref:Uncharacterized protein n=1 Tax=Lasiosphaeria hispida TaxID=260671 RepID=A0AAJ0MDQ0_9PEZI|nr:hypothetical protein B0T25DRAFT_567903 [Lasiosphaeria hispida]
MATDTKPRVLLVSLPPCLAVARVQRAKKADTVIHTLADETGPSLAVAVTDGFLVYNHPLPVWEAIITYMRRGGNVVLDINFAGSARLGMMGPFFATAGLTWSAGDYYRSLIAVQRSNVFNMIDAATRADRLRARNLQRQVDGEQPEGPRQVPIAFTKIGDGHLGYIGDVNYEGGPTRICLAMCGLPVKGPVVEESQPFGLALNGQTGGFDGMPKEEYARPDFSAPTDQPTISIYLNHEVRNGQRFTCRGIRCLGMPEGSDTPNGATPEEIIPMPNPGSASMNDMEKITSRVHGGMPPRGGH